jgi:hypothetical protein
VSDQYDYGYCDICDSYHENGCPRLNRAKKDSSEWYRLWFKQFGLPEEFADD